MTELGFEFHSESELNDAFYRFKQLADKKHEIFDEDLQALITEVNTDSEEEHYKKTIRFSDQPTSSARIIS
jgi:2-isopropylmalate synthase